MPGLGTIAYGKKVGHIGFHGTGNPNGLALPGGNAGRLRDLAFGLDAHGHKHQIGGGGKSL